MKTKLSLLVIFLLAIGGVASAQLVLPICSGSLPCPGFPLGSVQAPIDQNGWRNFKVTLTQNVTSFSFQGIPPSPAQAAVNIIFTQDATGGRTVTFASNVTNPCTVAAAANTTTMCQFEFDGVAGQWFGISGSGGTAKVINQQGPLAPITGTGAVANAYTFSVPAQSTGTVISVTSSMLHSSGTATAVTYAVTLGGQTVCTVTTSSFAAGPAQFVMKILVTGTTTATSVGNIEVGTPGFVSGTCAGSVTGLTWSGSQTLAVTFNVANTDQITPQALIVESAF